MMRRYLSEALGTFCLVFAGTAAIISNDLFGGAVTHAGISLVFGLIVMTMIYSVGDISGAHLNPAVTLGFWQLRLFPGRDVLPYILCQCLGALLASGCLKLMFPSHATLGATLPSVPLLSAFVIEVILTFMLMFVIIHVSEGSKEKGLMAGIAIGGVVALDALFGGPLTGASMNPARSLAPAIFSGQLSALWLYLIAPVVGVFIACFTCRLLRGDQCCQGVCST